MIAILGDRRRCRRSLVNLARTDLKRRATTGAGGENARQHEHRKRCSRSGHLNDPIDLASQALRTDIPGMPWTANSIFRLVEGRRKRILSQTDRSRPDRRIAHLPMRNSCLSVKAYPAHGLSQSTSTPSRRVQLAPAGCPISGRMSGSICHGTSTSGPLLPSWAAVGCGSYLTVHSSLSCN